MNLLEAYSEEEIGTLGDADHAGPWPAFVDLFAASSLVLLVFFAVLAFEYVQAKRGGPLTDELYGQLVAVKGRKFSVQRVPPNVLLVLEEQVVFPESRYEPRYLKEEGKESLREIGQLLRGRFRNQISEIEVLGHADRTKYPSWTGLTNWFVSSARAATVAQFLVEVDSVDPCIVIPSGRGEYYPRDTLVLENTRDTDERDRRIEILLHPVVATFGGGRRPGCRRR